MKDYEVKSGAVHCHAFLDGESYNELLSAVAKWWAPKDAERGTALEAITFWLDSSYNCHAYWVSLPPGFDFEAEVEKVLETERVNPLKLPEL